MDYKKPKPLQYESSIVHYPWLAVYVLTLYFKNIKYIVLADSSSNQTDVYTRIYKLYVYRGV